MSQENGSVGIGLIREPTRPLQQIGEMLAADDLIGAYIADLSLNRDISDVYISEHLAQADFVMGRHDEVFRRVAGQRHFLALCIRDAVVGINRRADYLDRTLICPARGAAGRREQRLQVGIRADQISSWGHARRRLG